MVASLAKPKPNQFAVDRDRRSYNLQADTRKTFQQSPNVDHSVIQNCGTPPGAPSPIF